MSRSLPDKQVALATQALELMFAVPQVIAQRMGRLTAGGIGGERGEMRRMGVEKADAAGEALYEVAVQLARSSHSAATSYGKAWWKAWLQIFCPWMVPGGQARFPVWGMTPGQMHHATLDVMAKGIAPVHRRAVANSKRLSRRR